MARVEELMAQGVLPAGWAPTAARAFSGFWRRFWASILDAILVFLVVGLPSLLLFSGFAEQAVPAVIGLVYYWVLEANGATLGKRALGIKIIDTDGQAPGLSRSAVRQTFDVAYLLLASLPGGLGLFLSFAGAIFLLADGLWMLGNDDRQTLHDKLAGTYVVRS